MFESHETGTMNNRLNWLYDVCHGSDIWQMSDENLYATLDIQYRIYI